jgi:uncharacterized protein YqjF (DUF2071 family)
MKATTTLRHFALVNFKADPVRLRSLIPHEFDLNRTEGGDTLVSAVPFQDTNFRFPWFPWIGFRFWQTNYRTYVVERGTGIRGVWFFGTDLGSPLAWIPRIAWSLPWFKAEYQTRMTDALYLILSKSKLSSSVFNFILSDEPSDLSPSDFELLSNPIVGFYNRMDGEIGTYDIEHPPMKLTKAVSVFSRCTLFERLGLVDYGITPHSVYVAEPIEFKINLPPKVFR